MTFNAASVEHKHSGSRWTVEVVELPKITTELPVSVDKGWKHLKDLSLADSDYGTPGYFDILLGVDVFNQVICQGRRTGLPGSSMALNTWFGWVLSRTVKHEGAQRQVTSCFSSYTTGDEILQKFWELESCNIQSHPFSLEEQTVVDHFNSNHHRDDEGRFIVPLPMKEDTKDLGESKLMAVRRFRSLERSL